MATTCLIRSPYHTQHLMTKLNSQRLYGLFCDVMICLQDEAFHLHRCVLAANSPKLSMLMSYMAASDKVLFLNDLSVYGFKKAVKYMYTGRIRLSPAHAHNVLSVARALQFAKLEQVCLNYFKNVLRIDPDVKVTLFRLSPHDLEYTPSRNDRELRTRRCKEGRNVVHNNEGDSETSSSSEGCAESQDEWQPSSGGLSDFDVSSGSLDVSLSDGLRQVRSPLPGINCERDTRHRGNIKRDHLHGKRNIRIGKDDASHGTGIYNVPFSNNNQSDIQREASQAISAMVSLICNSEVGLASVDDTITAPAPRCENGTNTVNVGAIKCNGDGVRRRDDDVIEIRERNDSAKMESNDAHFHQCSGIKLAKCDIDFECSKTDDNHSSNATKESCLIDG